MIIYLLYCPQSGKGYVGQTTTTLKRRWAVHCCDARKGSSFLIHKAIRKYGENAFELSTLQECSTIDELNAAEVFHIKQQNTLVPNGYNLLTGGRNFKMSEETKEKHRKAATGRKMSPEAVEKMAASKRGKTHTISAETRQKIAAAHTGMKAPPEAKASMKAAQKKAWREGKYDNRKDHNGNDTTSSTSTSTSTQTSSSNPGQ